MSKTQKHKEYESPKIKEIKKAHYVHPPYWEGTRFQPIGDDEKYKYVSNIPSLSRWSPYYDEDGELC